VSVRSFSNFSAITFLRQGFYWREIMTEGGAEEEAWKYLAVTAPIVVFFAPFGSFLSSHFHRQVLAALVYVLDTAALVMMATLMNNYVPDRCLPCSYWT